MEVQLSNPVPPLTRVCRVCGISPVTNQCDFGLVYLKTGQLELTCKSCIFNRQETMSECILCKNEGKELTLSGPQPQLRVHLCNVHETNHIIDSLDTFIINKLVEIGLTKPHRLLHECFVREVQITLDGKVPTKCNYC